MEFSLSPEHDPERDTKNFLDIIAAVPVTGATIKIADNGKSLKLDQRVAAGAVIDKPVIIRGETPNSRIEKYGRFYISYKRAGLPTHVIPNTVDKPNNNKHKVWEFEGLYAGFATFECKGLELAKGDWVSLLSDDPIIGIPSHYPGGKTCPIEIHRVSHVSGDTVTLSSPVKNHMMENPRIQKMDMINNAGMYDLTLGSEVGTAELTAGTHSGFIFIDSVFNFRVNNVWTDDTGSGFVLLKRGVHCRFEGLSGLSQPNPRADYGFVVICGNDVVWSDSFWHECRHAFTTSGFGAGKIRYAGMTGVEVRNVTVNCPSDEYGHNYTVFHTHPEGEVIFRDCTVNAASASPNDPIVGYTLKARDSSLIGCKFFGNVNTNRGFQNTCTGIKLLGSNQKVERCHVERAWFGLRFYRGSRYANHQIHDNSFNNCSTAAIQIGESVRDVSVTNNRIRNSGYFDNTGRPQVRKTLIDVKSGKNLKFRGNTLDRCPNSDYAFAFEGVDSKEIVIEGNYVRGYGLGRLGILGAYFDPNGYQSVLGQTLNVMWAQSNYTGK